MCREISLQYLKGVGPSWKKKLIKLGIHTLGDLFYYFPFRYQDKRKVSSIKELEENKEALIEGKVLVRNLRYPKRRTPFTRLGIFEALVSDGKDRILCIWFNQSYLKNVIKAKDKLWIFGKVRRYRNRLCFICPEFEKAEGSFTLGRIVGVYRVKEGMSQRRLRRIIFENLRKYAHLIEEPIPFYIRERLNLPNINKSLWQIHFPSDSGEIEISRKRFIFEELFFSQILIFLRKTKRRLKKGVTFKVKQPVIDRIKQRLGFQLTTSQKETLFQVLEDMKKDYPMCRLIQGDVGCGKTAVALFAIGVCVSNGYQAVFCVPTEVLAHQHFITVSNIFKDLKYKVEILVSSLPVRKKREIIKELREGKINVVVGTHALLEEEVKFKNLGLVVIDEQHKFGVAQRVLLSKKGNNPDCLVMSATPIPRSLALSLYGDLDLSIIKEKPPGRKEPTTFTVNEKDREKVYSFVKRKLKEGRQAFFVFSVIEESEDEEILSLERMYERIKEEFSSFKVEMLHGRIKSEEKERIIKEYAKGRIDILVATTVVEVGLNVENATVMVIENPEKFGLAQLHQLRGRIQRATFDSYFILILRENLSENAKKRIKILEKTNDGFKIAEEDLALRGPGEFFGLRQAGFSKSYLANPLKEVELLKEARKMAYEVIRKDPLLKNSCHRPIKKHLNFWLSFFQKDNESS
ncbi:MAG: DNA helicase RecG [Candidatus Omnitrophota bacterium]|nr:MAG: DNA helicase RecG [Candidatus Omnitrophota bacterium]